MFLLAGTELYQIRLHCKERFGYTLLLMVTKRQLGIAFIAIGVLGILGSLAVDIVSTDNFQGIGPMQMLSLLGFGLVLFVGITLLPFGDRPA